MGVIFYGKNYWTEARPDELFSDWPENEQII
jgi:hypothetical protein